MKVLGWQDEHGDESLIGPVIFITTFLVVGGFIATSLSDIKYIVDEPLEGYDTIGGLDYNMWTLDEGGVCNTSRIYSNPWDVTHPLMGIFTDLKSMAVFSKPAGSASKGSAVTVYVVRNHSDPDPSSEYKELRYRDMFILHRTSGPWYWTRNYWAVIPFEKVLGEAEGNTSATFSKLNHNVTLFISTWGYGDAIDFPTQLYNNHFNMSFGVILGAELVGRSSMWAVLGQLLTFSLPDMDMTMRFVIGVPMWACIGFVAVTIVSRFIPFIGGG